MTCEERRIAAVVGALVADAAGLYFKLRCNTNHGQFIVLCSPVSCHIL